jgi:SAM-dependent methyltransferase
VATTETARTTSFGQEGRLTPVDRLGVWLSGRSIRRGVDSFEGKRVGDFGCGYNASFARTLLPVAASVTLVDVALADDLKEHPGVRAVEGPIPETLRQLPTGSLDIVLCVSALEHLSEPAGAAAEFLRLLAPGGVLLVNVPTWLGKRFLEFSAFRLGLSPREEMDDHKAYYDPKDLWLLLRKAGFLPHNIRCFRHKFGLNAFAVCRVEPNDGP